MRGDNVTLACVLCNGLKGDMTPAEWAEFMVQNPEWWLNPKFSRANKHMLPIEHTRFILKHGKKEYREWAAGQQSDDDVNQQLKDPS